MRPNSQVKASLWKISVRISPESEETVVESLRAIFGESASVYVDARTQASTAELYLPAKPTHGVFIRFQRRLKEIRSAEVSTPVGDVKVARLPSQDWAESWKRHFKPIDIDGRLLIRPTWSKRRAQRGQAVVVLDPGLSFGTGQHATTQFCLKQIVRVRRPEIAQSFLDIGTGSGILAIAAAKLGYTPIHGFDIDCDAVRIAIDNARKNRVADRMRFECRDVAKLTRPKNRYDLICANLIYDVLLKHKARIIAQLSQSGILVLAGILRTQFNQVIKSYGESGMRLIRSQSEGEWKSGVLVPKTTQLAASEKSSLHRKQQKKHLN